MTGRVFALCAAALALTACSGDFVKVAPVPPPQFVTTRETSGTACGVMLFAFIPINYNDRAARAYKEAIDRVDAEGLINTTITDRWYYIYVGGLYCTDVRGVGFRTGPAGASAADR